MHDKKVTKPCVYILYTVVKKYASLRMHISRKLTQLVSSPSSKLLSPNNIVMTILLGYRMPNSVQDIVALMNSNCMAGFSQPDL